MKIKLIKQTLESIKDLMKSYEKINLRFSLLRLLSFLVFVGAILLGVFVSELFYILSAASVVIFFVLAYLHNRHSDLMKIAEYKIGTLESYLARSTDAWKDFSDKGGEFLDKNEFYQSDLDIFGNASLYQYMVTAKTPYGRRMLADALKNSKKDDLVLRQEAIKELAESLDLALDIEASGRVYNASDKCNISINSLERMGSSITEDIVLNPLNLILAIIFPIAFFVTLILFIVGAIGYQYPILLLLLNFASIYLFKASMNKVLTTIFESSLTIDSYINFLSVNKYQVKSKILNEILTKMRQYEESLKSFHSRASIVNARRNIIVLILGNGLFQFDFWCLFIFKAWQKKYSNDILEYIKTVGYLEELNSLATISRVKDTTTPIVSDRIAFTDLVHPLLRSDIAVGNDFELRGLDIITGSNMSGKTTFMRTIGVNMILFNAGSQVTGKSFEAFYMKIFTSMRATDDISQGISTFYAEILRIKDMLSYVDKKEPTLVLVDEIFKGTNTIDRICGAKGAIKRLSKPHVYGLIATHDNELCECVKENYHYAEEYKGDEISFDYKIKSGIARTTNAKHLMRMAGIIGDDEIE